MKRIHRLKLHAVVGAFTLQCFRLLIKYRLTFIILEYCATTRNEFICIERADLPLLYIVLDHNVIHFLHFQQ